MEWNVPNGKENKRFVKNDNKYYCRQKYGKFLKKSTLLIKPYNLFDGKYQLDLQILIIELTLILKSALIKIWIIFIEFF